MRKRRLAYWLVLAVLAVFLFFFSRPFFLWALAVLGVLALWWRSCCGRMRKS